MHEEIFNQRETKVVEEFIRIELSTGQDHGFLTPLSTKWRKLSSAGLACQKLLRAVQGVPPCCSRALRYVLEWGAYQRPDLPGHRLRNLPASCPLSDVRPIQPYRMMRHDHFVRALYINCVRRKILKTPFLMAPLSNADPLRDASSCGGREPSPEASGDIAHSLRTQGQHSTTSTAPTRSKAGMKLPPLGLPTKMLAKERTAVYSASSFEGCTDWPSVT